MSSEKVIRAKKSSWPKTETELAKVIVTWLQDLKWEVYQEVQLRRGGPVADIVAVQKPLIWIVECKRAFTVDVLEQVLRWNWYAHYLSVAVPHGKKRAEHIIGDSLLADVCRWKGVGVMMCRESGDVDEWIHPVLHRKISTNPVLRVLKPEHQTFAEAGNASGSHYSPFQDTCAKLRVMVAKSPGITLGEVLRTLAHHYGATATARACLLKWGLAGSVKGVRFVRQDRKVKLFPVDCDFLLDAK